MTNQLTMWNRLAPKGMNSQPAKASAFADEVERNPVGDRVGRLVVGRHHPLLELRARLDGLSLPAFATVATCPRFASGARRPTAAPPYAPGVGDGR